MSYCHHHERETYHSRESDYRHIKWMRKSKRWLRKCMIAIVALLAIAIVLSYVFITKEPEPQGIEVHKTLLDRI